MHFDELLRAAPELYGKVQVVLLLREVHMMKNCATLDTALRRGGPGQVLDDGYLPEAWVAWRSERATG